MTRPPPGYRGPQDRDPDQVMADVAAQNLIAEIIGLHQALDAKLTHDIDLAALGPADPASGFVTGSSDHDRMETRQAAIHQAKADRTRELAAAREMLRRVVRYYEERLGRRPPTRPRVESIDYRNDGQRRVG